MSRDSDETTRLVEGHRQAHGRVSGNLDDDEDIGEDIYDFIKGRLVGGLFLQAADDRRTSPIARQPRMHDTGSLSLLPSLVY